MRKGAQENKIYKNDLEGTPSVDPFVLVSEAFDHPSSSSQVNVASGGDSLAKRLLHAKPWLELDKKLVSLLINTELVCNLMSLGCCKKLGALVQHSGQKLISFYKASSKFV